MIDIRLVSLHKYYSSSDEQPHEALSGISMDINQGNSILISGPSGSGKTTLMMTIGGLLSPDKGSLHINKHNFFKLGNRVKDEIRAEYISYIFQKNLLIPELSVLDNILFPFQIKQKITKDIIKRALFFLEYFGMFRMANKNIKKLSGGEQQLVNFIRGIMPDFSILLADEPTSELDTTLSVKVFEHLKKINGEKNATVVLISHDPVAKNYVKESYRMQGGRITEYQKLI